MTLRPHLRLLPTALLCSCVATTVDGPDAGKEGLRVDALVPSTAWGGDVVEVRGAALGDTGELVRVVFTGGAETAATQLGDGRALRVVVPSDTRTGPVTVVTQSGQARAPEPFTFLGPDAVQGAIATSVDLKLDVWWAAPGAEPGSTIVRTVDAAVLQDASGGARPYPAAIAVLDGARPVTAELSTGCGGELALVLHRADLVEERRVCLPGADQLPDVHEVALSDDRRFVAVSSSHGGRVWTWDPDSDLPPRRFELDAEFVEPPQGGPSSLFGVPCFTGGITSIAFIDAAAGTTQRIALTTRTQVAVGLGRTHVAVSVESPVSEVRVYELAGEGESPVHVRTLETPFALRETGIEFLRWTDGDARLLGASLSHVFAWDLAGVDPLPLRATHIPLTRSLAPDGPDRFTLAHRGGVTTFASDSLAPLWTTKVSARLSNAVLFTTAAGDERVAVARNADEVVIVLTPSGHVDTRLRVGGEVVTMVPGRVPGELFVLTDDAVWRTSGDVRERVQGLPDGAVASTVKLLDTGILVVAWELDGQAWIEWIAPDAPAGARLLWSYSTALSLLWGLHAHGSRLAIVSAGFDIVGGFDVELIECAGITASPESPGPAVELALALPSLPGFVAAGDTLFLTAPEGSQLMSAVRIHLPSASVQSHESLLPVGLDAIVSPSGRQALWARDDAVFDTTHVEWSRIQPATLGRASSVSGFAAEGRLTPLQFLSRGDGALLVDRELDRVVIVR